MMIKLGQVSISFTLYDKSFINKIISSLLVREDNLFVLGFLYFSMDSLKQLW